MNLEDVKELQNIFKSNLNEILRGWFKSKEQKGKSEYYKLVYESQQALIK